MTGSVLSIFIVTEPELDSPAPFVAEHVSVVPEVLLTRVAGTQPAEVPIPDSGSVRVQLTPTLLVYQPFAPRVPVRTGVITGEVLSILIVTGTELDSPAPFVAEQVID